ncbi:MAG TPA: hypothetical protein QF630_02060, partial [Alphaproteobacteria bacterium]|nr:hypothetical protein [Alphaproteobacteria bacterium]
MMLDEIRLLFFLANVGRDFNQAAQQADEFSFVEHGDNIINAFRARLLRHFGHVPGTFQCNATIRRNMIARHSLAPIDSSQDRTIRLVRRWMRVGNSASIGSRYERYYAHRGNRWRAVASELDDAPAAQMPAGGAAQHAD